MSAKMKWDGIELKGKQIAFELVSSESLVGDDEQDTALLRGMSRDARDYLSSFSWCGSVLDSYFGGGVGGIFAVFFFHIRPNSSEVDPWIWIVVGDIPPAYLPLTDCNSPAEVFRVYIECMSRWVEFARRGQPDAVDSPDVPPVNVPPTPEWAEELGRRLQSLARSVKPLFEE
jgi:hypothetical protein